MVCRFCVDVLGCCAYILLIGATERPNTQVMK
jgi:hypothetical protein